MADARCTSAATAAKPGSKAPPSAICLPPLARTILPGSRDERRDVFGGRARGGAGGAGGGGAQVVSAGGGGACRAARRARDRGGTTRGGRRRDRIQRPCRLRSTRRPRRALPEQP